MMALWCPASADNTFERDEVVRAADGERRDPMSHVAFGWQNNLEGVVYIHCVVIGCISDNSDDCIATSTSGSCPANKRKRRAVSGASGVKTLGDAKVGTNRILKPMTISSQPLFFVDPFNQGSAVAKDMTLGQSFTHILGLTDSQGRWMGMRRSQLSLSFIGGMACLLLKVIHSWYKKNKQINKNKQNNISSIENDQDILLQKTG
ncbi:uncharacterized protein LOC142345136 [Convolutriloba macropyga]|uniref:uncharacterized protein LOC142345136 n=1 Tax=Convolutriloba macropyga TaxID=536237 RepID=UPI003F51B6DC